MWTMNEKHTRTLLFPTCRGLSAGGGRRGKEEGAEESLRVWMSFCYLVLFALARPISSGLASPSAEQVLKVRGGALNLNGNPSWGGCDCLSALPKGPRAEAQPHARVGAGSYRLISVASTSPPVATPKGDCWGSWHSSLLSWDQ